MSKLLNNFIGIDISYNSSPDYIEYSTTRDKLNYLKNRLLYAQTLLKLNVDLNADPNGIENEKIHNRENIKCFTVVIETIKLKIQETETEYENLAQIIKDKEPIIIVSPVINNNEIPINPFI